MAETRNIPGSPGGFAGKVALVTGAGRGIGRAIAEAFAAAGAQVALAEVDVELGEAQAQRMGQAGRFFACDVADESQVAQTVVATVQAFGKIDCLVNNAAISRGKPLSELTVEDWGRVIGVNLTGPMLMTRQAGPYLAKAGGAIVNIASTRAMMSEANSEAYSATKAGLVGLTHATAVSLGPDVRVNCISPGWIDTRDYRPGGPGADPLSDDDHGQHPCGRVGRPEDIAAMVLHLCSDAAGFITGQNVVVDGGMTKKMIYVE